MCLKPRVIRLFIQERVQAYKKSKLNITSPMWEVAVLMTSYVKYITELPYNRVY